MSYGRFSLPKGFRFQPSDEVLLSHYLQKKNQREDPEITAIIPEIDVTKHEPRDLPALVFTRAEFLDKEWFTMADSPDMEWYFFSPRVFKHSNSKSQSTKINRTTKEGSWKKQGNDRRITGACSDKQIGGRRILTFYLSKKKKTDWVIHEYYLTKADSDEQIGDFVLCRLKDNRLKKKSGKPDHGRQDAPEDQAFSELGNVVIPKGNDDEAKAEHGGGSCSMALNVESPASKQLENVLPIPYGNDDDAEHGGGRLVAATSSLVCLQKQKNTKDSMHYKMLFLNLMAMSKNLEAHKLFLVIWIRMIVRSPLKVNLILRWLKSDFMSQKIWPYSIHLRQLNCSHQYTQSWAPTIFLMMNIVRGNIHLGIVSLFLQRRIILMK